MVHPPFAWQLASFPSLPVCGEEAPYCPLRDFATLRTYSPEIKARQALFAFLPVYPELVALIEWNIPNYQGVFLRRYGGQHGIGGASGSFGVTGGQGYDWKYGGTGNTYWGGINFYASRVTPVVGEVRPVNRAVRYFIRAR